MRKGIPDDRLAGIALAAVKQPELRRISQTFIAGDERLDRTGGIAALDGREDFLRGQAEFYALACRSGLITTDNGVAERLQPSIGLALTKPTKELAGAFRRFAGQLANGNSDDRLRWVSLTVRRAHSPVRRADISVAAQETVDACGIAIVHRCFDVGCGQAGDEFGMAVVTARCAAAFEKTAIISQACGQVALLAVVSEPFWQVLTRLQPCLKLIEASVGMELIEIAENTVDLSDLAHLGVDRLAGVILSFHPRIEFHFPHAASLSLSLLRRSSAIKFPVHHLPARPALSR